MWDSCPAPGAPGPLGSLPEMNGSFVQSWGEGEIGFQPL